MDLRNEKYEKIDEYFNQNVRVLSSSDNTQFVVQLTIKRAMDTIRKLEALRQAKQLNQDKVHIEQTSSSILQKRKTLGCKANFNRKNV